MKNKKMIPTVSFFLLYSTLYTTFIVSKKIKKSNLIFLTALVILLCFSFIYFKMAENRYRSVTSFDSCLHAGFKVVQGVYPEECSMPGKKFINPRQATLPVERVESVVIPSLDYKNLTYLFGEETLYLTDGVGTLAADVLTKRATTTLRVSTGTEFMYDINADTVADTVFILNGTTSLGLPVAYITAAVSLNTGFSGINLVPLHAPIASTSIIYKNGGLTLTYTAASSSRPLSQSFVFESGLLKERVNH